jgi:hypothetical protein
MNTSLLFCKVKTLFTTKFFSLTKYVVVTKKGSGGALLQECPVMSQLSERSTKIDLHPKQLTP